MYSRPRHLQQDILWVDDRVYTSIKSYRITIVLYMYKGVVSKTDMCGCLIHTSYNFANSWQIISHKVVWVEYTSPIVESNSIDANCAGRYTCNYHTIVAMTTPQTKWQPCWKIKRDNRQRKVIDNLNKQIHVNR